MTMLSVRLVLHCLLLIIFCQHVEVEVEVDQLWSSDSPLLVEANTLTEDSKSQIHLKRQKRNVNQQTAYEIDIVLSKLQIGFSLDALQIILDNVTYPFSIYIQNGSSLNITSITPSTVNQQIAYEIDIELSRLKNGFSLDTLQMILDNVTYLFSINIQNGSSINITGITPTTACQFVNNEIQCTCISEFTWNSTFCRMHQSCRAYTTADQTCKCIRGYPIEGEFCELIPTQNTIQTTAATMSTSTTMSSPSTSTSTTTISTTSPSTMTSTSTTTTTTTSPSTSTTSPSTTTSISTTSPSTTSTSTTTTTTTSPPTTTSTSTTSTPTTSPSTTTPTTSPSTSTTMSPSTMTSTSTTTTTTTTTSPPTTTSTSTTSTPTMSPSTTTPTTSPSTSTTTSPLTTTSTTMSTSTTTSTSTTMSSSSTSTSTSTSSSRAMSSSTDMSTSIGISTSTNTSISAILLHGKGEDEIPCTDSEFGTTKFNSTATIPCVGMEGNRTRRCGKNGKYDDEHDFCLMPAISHLLKVTKSSAEVAKNFSRLLHELSLASQEQNITKPGNVEAVVTILTTFSEVNNTVNETDLENFLQTVNTVISNKSIEAWRILSNLTAKTNIHSKLLLSVETFSCHLNLMNDTLDIKMENLQFRATKIDSRETKRPMKVTFGNFSTEGYTNLSANIFIPTDELEKLVNNVVVTIAYPTWADILPSNANFKGNFSINGLVVTIKLSDKKSIKTQMNFSARNPALDFNSAQCVFWDFTLNGTWNNAGCMPVLDGEDVICNCEHLTSFSILMSAKTVEDSILNSITQIGVAISLASLIITIIIEAVVWRHVTMSKASHIRHVAILNIVINLLIADVWFIVAASVKQESATCVAATFFIHVFYLAVFFWMFTLGLLILYHLVFLFHNLSRPVLMGISFGIGYLCPIIISAITIGVTYPQESYLRKDACWLSWREKYPILAFIIPALVIIANNVIVLVVVIFKLLQPTTGDRPRGHNEENDTIKLIVRSIAVLTPILGLTWAFGIPTFQKNPHMAFQYIFTILNVFQGFFILVFVTCMDKKVQEALLKKFPLTGFSSLSEDVPEMCGGHQDVPEMCGGHQSEQTASTGRVTSKNEIALSRSRKKLNISVCSHSDGKDKLLGYSNC